MWDTYTIWRMEVCAWPCCCTEGVLLKTPTLSNIPLKAAMHITDTEKCTCRFICSLLAVITASLAHLCSCLCYMLQGVHVRIHSWVNVKKVLLKNKYFFQSLNLIKLLLNDILWIMPPLSFTWPQLHKVNINRDLLEALFIPLVK